MPGAETFLLVQCGARKVSAPGPVPARELYSGPLFTQARRYADRFYPGRWGVLSAKYGIVLPDTLIAPYDLRLEWLAPPELGAWRVQVRLQLRQLKATTILLHAGQFYVRAFQQSLPPPPPVIQVVDELHGLKLGFRLQWYKRHFTPRSAFAMRELF